MEEQKTLKLAVQLAPPYLLYNEAEDGDILLQDGPDVQLLKSIQEKYGFEYNIFQAPDKEWGRIENDTWTGLIGMINRTEVDIAAGCISMTYLRNQATDFTYPYNVENGVIITKKPMIRSKVYAVIMPFTKEVWALIFFALIVKVLVMQRVVNRSAQWRTAKPPTFSRIFWFVFGLLCSEGGRINLFHSRGAKLLIGLWLMFVVVIQSSYSGTLMSFLSIPGREAPINTLTDLANAIISQKNFQCGCMKGSSSFETLRHLEGKLSIIGKTVLENSSNFLDSVEEGIKRTQRGNYAFLSQEIASSYEAHKIGTTDYHMSTEGYVFELVAIAMRRNFPYRQQFNDLIIRLTETGVIEKWKRDQIHPTAQRSRLTDEIMVTALSVTDLQGALRLCAYGYSLSLIVFIAERCYARRRRAKHTKV